MKLEKYAVKKKRKNKKSKKSITFQTILGLFYNKEFMTLIILAFRIAHKLMLLSPLLQFNQRQGSLKFEAFAASKTSLMKHQRNIKIVNQVLNMITLSS